MTLALINSFPASNKSQKPSGPRVGGAPLWAHVLYKVLVNDAAYIWLSSGRPQLEFERGLFDFCVWHILTPSKRVIKSKKQNFKL